MEETTKGAHKEDFLKERYLCSSEKLEEPKYLIHLKTDGMTVVSLRDAYCLVMEAFMMVRGATERDRVLEHSTSTMGMFSRDRGGMMSCMARYFSSSFCFFNLFDLLLLYH